MLKNNNGLTLIELLIAILLIGIISAIAYPNINDWMTDRAVKKEAIRYVAYLEKKKIRNSTRRSSCISYWNKSKSLFNSILHDKRRI